MAKIEIAIPDDLLGRIDRAADRAEVTREEFLRRAVEQEVLANEAAFRKEIEDLLGPPIHGGGGWAEWIRWDRDHRDDKKFGPARDDD